MSLASHLMKHLAVVKLCGFPWSKSVINRDEHGKPCFRPLSADGKMVDFNVSHQAGIVTLIGCSNFEVEVGTDVVCVNERNDYSMIERDGLFAWIDLHADVFAPSEVQHLKFDTTNLTLPEHPNLAGYARDAIARCQWRHKTVSYINASGKPEEIASNIIVDAKLRRFYALWCLREAYVKMTGEALLADWLQRLEFRKFEVPTAIEGSDNLNLLLGGVVTNYEIFFKGRKVDNVAMELRALGRDYMVASAMRSRSGGSEELEFPGFYRAATCERHLASC